MTSKERLLAAMRLEEPDRVPISTYELVGLNPDAWENREPSYRRLMDAIREKTDCICMTGLRRALPPRDEGDRDREQDVETWTEGPSTFTRRVVHTPKGNLTSLTRRDAGLHTTWTLEHPLKSIDDIDLYLSRPWRAPEFDPTAFFRLRDRVADGGVMMLSVGDPICEAAQAFEMGAFLVHAMTERRRIGAFLEAIHERQMASLRSTLACGLEGTMFRICGPEYATPPFLPPALFGEYVTPYLRRIIEAVRSAGCYARVHCHGRIGEVVDQIVDAGAQGLDPVEAPPDGDVTLAEVKRRHGDRLCLFGNIELRELERSPPERVESLVRRAMREAKEGGGFVLMPTAAPINVPLAKRTEENYLRFIDAGLEYGKY